MEGQDSDLGPQGPLNLASVCLCGLSSIHSFLFCFPAAQVTFQVLGDLKYCPTFSLHQEHLPFTG